VDEDTELFCSFVFPVLEGDHTFVKIHPLGMYCVLFLKSNLSVLSHVHLDSKRGERGNPAGKQMEPPVSVASEMNMGAANNVSSGTKPSVDLDMMFFDLEVTMENNLLCRDVVCTQTDSERRK
jgi:hypothetical protein